MNVGYDGTVHLYDNQGNLFFAKHVNSIKETDRYYSIEEENIKKAQARWVEVCNTITTYHYKDWFKAVYDRFGNVISVTFLYTTFEGTSERQECKNEWRPDYNVTITCDGCVPKTKPIEDFEPTIICPDGFIDDGLGNCIEKPIKNNRYNLIEEQINYSELDPCLEEIMGHLKNATNTDIANILTKLGPSSIYTVNMVMKPTIKLAYAETERISKYNYEIRLDRERDMGGTKLYKATAMIHEIIHAYFLSIIDDYNSTPSTALPTFADLFEVYVKRENPTSTDKSDAQHLTMAKKYVDAMASALREYDDNNAVPYQVYQDLAWGSLMHAPIFKATFPEGSADNIRIKNRYGCESVGHAVEMGTPIEQTPIGKPCSN